MSLAEKRIVGGVPLLPLSEVLSVPFPSPPLSSTAMSFLTPSHSSIVLGAPLPPPPALLRDAPILSSTEKRNVGSAPLPTLPAVLSVPFLPLP